MSFSSRAEYERLIYGLSDEHAQIFDSTLRLYSTSALTAIVEGTIHLRSGLAIRVVKALDFKVGRIRHYSYTVFRGDEKIRWYDSQPHPEIPELASTFPHHYHELPNIKRNRHPSPGIHFEASNLARLIADCITLGDTLAADPD